VHKIKILKSITIFEMYSNTVFNLRCLILIIIIIINIIMVA